jgi:hypothetical protein
MGNFTKSQQRREKMKVDFNLAKQSKLDDLSFQFNTTRSKEAVKSSKAIVITCITDIIKEDELALKIEFSLLPSKVLFSKISLDLYFQEQLIDSTSLHIYPSLLLGGSLEFPQFLDMKGITTGNYQIRVEMYEPWASGEKLNFTSKEITVQYVPQTRAERLVKFPTVKSVAGTDLTVVSSSTKDIYRKIEEDLKKEIISKRDEW